MTKFKFDGMMGLSPNVIKSNTTTVTDNIIMKFFESGSIKAPIFSLYLGFYTEKSKMIIGGYDETKILQQGTKRTASDDSSDNTKSDDGIFWMYISPNNYWMVNMYEATVNNQNIDIGGYAEILINSGVSINYIPTKSY